MDKTKIEWCDSTWNPVTGCCHHCEYCYAEKMVNRFSGDRSAVKYGTDEMIHKLDKALRGDKTGKVLPYPFGFEPTLHRYHLNDYANKKAKTIFVCSMADLFGSWVPDEWIEEVFAACEKAPQHRYLFLTKNPQRYIDLATAGKLPIGDNMWYGTTATTPDEPYFWGGAWHTFVSIEPILKDYTGEIENMCHTFAQWVIIGAETGNRKEKVIPKASWITEIIKTCIVCNIPVFMKDSLIPIVGEENMFRHLPWRDNYAEQIAQGQKWLDDYYEKVTEVENEN